MITASRSDAVIMHIQGSEPAFSITAPLDRPEMVTLNSHMYATTTGVITQIEAMQGIN